MQKISLVLNHWGKKTFLLTIFWVFIQLFVLWIVIGKYSYVLITWTEVIVKTSWYDPRDLFRGEYVRINYDIEKYIWNNYESWLCEYESSYSSSRWKDIFVVPLLDKNNYAVWIDKIVKNKKNIEKWKLYIKAKIDYCDYEYIPWNKKEELWENYNRVLESINIDYEKDRFFVKEWTWKPLEDKLRDNDIDSYAVWKVASNGSSILSHLLVDWEHIK